jgi:hypothetical protein
MSFPREHWDKISSTDEIDKRFLRHRVAASGQLLQERQKPQLAEDEEPKPISASF